MKRHFAFALLAGATIAAGAQKIDLRARAVIERHRAAVESKVDLNGNQDASRQRIQSLTNAMAERATLLIEVADASDLSRIEAAGGEITGVYGNVITCDMPIEKIESLDNDDNIISVTTPRRMRLLNDKGRAASGMNVDAAHEGTDLKQAYKGDGVVVGLFDGGLDPNHINFYNDDQSATRVSRLWRYVYNQYTGKTSATSYTNASSIAKFTTDDSSETHGTHVLGTIAGSYDGGTTTTRYYGVAPHAEIAIACGDATDDAILAGVQNIADYAKAQGKPAVINLSLGTNLGHHDGSDSFSKALNEIAKTTPIVVAAGNEADTKIVARKVLTASDNVAATVLVPNMLYLQGRYQAYGGIEVISNSSKTFTLQLGLYDTSTKTVTASITASGSSYKGFAGTNAEVSGTSNSVFTSNFSNDSYLVAAIGRTPSNRAYALVECDLYYSKANSKVLPVLIVTGSDGQTIEFFTEGYTMLSDEGIAGYIDGTTDGTISDMACGPYTISAGAYATRNSYPYSGETIGDIVSYSSYGKLIDGRTLPHICAPGQAIVSSMSTPYRNSNNFDSSYDKVYSTVTANGRSNYWCHMGGTSMAAPGVAGCLALWLEANPDLTPEELLDIATSTARKDSYVTAGKSQAPYQWGAGKIDAYEGLKEVLKRADSGVDGITVDNDSRLMVKQLGERSYEVHIAGAESLNVSLVNVAGSVIATTQADGDTAIIDAANVAGGVYILAVQTPTSNEAVKVAIK